MSNDTINVQRGIVGAGSDDDTYVLSGSLIDANAEITISDVEGANKIQLIGGLTISSSIVAGDTVQLTLSNGAVVTVLGASTMSFEVGGNPLTGTAGSTKDYSTFATDVLGTTVPTDGTNSTGGESTVNEDGTSTGGIVVPTYALTAGATSVDEGATATFSLATTDVADGTAVAYTISGVDAADVSGGSLTGTATVTSGAATISVALLADLTTEGAETLTVTIDGQTATASTTVNDTSITPDATASFSLTAGGDNFTGGTGNDTFTANVAVDGNGVANVETLTAIDVLDGGAGTDSLTYYTVGGTALPGTAFSNIETVNVVSDGAVTADVQNNSGVTSLSAQAVTDVDIDTNGNVTSVTITGSAESVAIDDNATTDVITSVSITGAGNTAGDNAKDINSTVLNTLSLTNITGTENDDDADDIDTDSTSSSLVINLNNVSIDAADILAATATGVTLNTSGTTAIVVDDVDFSVATSATINSDAAITIDGLDVAAVTTLTLTGSARTTLTAGTYTALTTFDASGSTGGVTLTAALDTADLFTGGSGNDVLTSVGATTKDHTLGAGDDSATLTVAALGTSGTIDAGAGTDTLGLTAANAVTASATTGATAFETTISNFEKVSIGAVAADAGVSTVNMAGLDDINYIVSAGITGNDGGDSLVLTNVVTGGTFELTGDNAAAEDGTTITVSGAATNASDVFNVHLNTGVAASVVVADTITLASVETVNISTADTGTATGADIASSTHTMTLVGTSATTVVVTGNNGLTLTNTGNTLISSFDASAVAGDSSSTLDTAANLAVGFTSDNITTAVTITGGAGNDALSADAASTKVNTISGGAGTDTLTGGAGADVLSGGDGADVLVATNGGADSLTGGAGNDNFNVGVSTSGTTYASIKDLAAGDFITLGAALGNAFTTTAVTAGANAVFQDYLDSAASTADNASWFQYSGNTYVVGSANGTGGFTNGTDTVVEIVGLVDLSTATITDDVLTIA